jgi:hypothetical protein
MLGTFQRASGLGRIGVDPNRVELSDFETFGATSGIPAADLQAMKHRGRKQGANPRNWLASFAQSLAKTGLLSRFITALAGCDATQRTSTKLAKSNDTPA